jgi:hypothetical protein
MMGTCDRDKEPAALLAEFAQPSGPKPTPDHIAALLGGKFRGDCRQCRLDRS